MRDIELGLGQARPISRELVELPQRSGVRRLHVDRPCHVHRQDHGHWGWRCSLCPLPLCLASVETNSWQEAVDEADRHIRTMHSTDSTDGAPAAVNAGTHPWELAA